MTHKGVQTTTDTKRIKECRRKIIAALNDAKIPYAVSELILESVLLSLIHI